MSCLAGSTAQRLQSLQSCYLAHMGGPMLPLKFKLNFIQRLLDSWPC